MTVLVIDVGSTSVRSSLVGADGTVSHQSRLPAAPVTPFPGLVEIDPVALASGALECAERTLDAARRAGVIPDSLAVTAQRASAVAWNATTGAPVATGLAWQDLRTAGTCLELQDRGLRLSPSETATKFAWQVQQAFASGTEPGVIRLGTVESWIAWNLTRSGRHITDPSNAAVTGLYSIAHGGWNDAVLDVLGLDRAWLPEVVDTCAEHGSADALSVPLPLRCLVGDQQASLAGQGATLPGLGKATFGTGGMLDICTGEQAPGSAVRSDHGCFPIVAWRRDGRVTWGLEALMLTAGSAVEWLVEDLGVLSDAVDSDRVAASCEDSEGVVVVPAFLGQATPQWDFGARGAVFGLSRGSGVAQLVRAVLEGVAHAGADLLEAAEADSGVTLGALRVDGGMSANSVFVQALADACGRPVEVSPELEATTVGAGYLAGLVDGTWQSLEDIARAWKPKTVIAPSGRDPKRDRWRRAVERAAGWHPELSAIQF
jgi:glycerol kinase